jgi:phenylacetate-CoA ligase
MNDQVKYYTKNNLYTRLVMNRIEKACQLSDKDRLKAYEQAFLRLFQKAYNNSKFYKNLYDEAGVNPKKINSLESIFELPIIDRSTIKDREDEIYIGSKWPRTTGLTSGTSGSPLVLYRHFLDICTEQAYVRYHRQKHGYRVGQPLLSLRGVLGKSEPYYYFKPANILYISTPNLNKGTIQMYQDLIQRFNPVAVEAFPSYLHKLCLELESAELSLNIPVAFTSSETLLSWQREKIESSLNTRIFDWYGNAERSILLAQDDAGKYQPAPLYSINEFKEDSIITTALTHDRFPLIRYQVPDRIQVRSSDFYENLIRPDILSIEGRSSDNIELKDGSVVGCIDHAFKGVAHLEMAQVHQYSVHEPIRIKLVKSPLYSVNEEEQLIRNWRRMVGQDMELIFESCKREDLTHLPGKKFQLIIKKNPTAT